MDVLDHLQVQEEFFETLLKEQRLPVPVVPSATLCQACGNEIDERRREHIPGVQLCFDCQTLEEQRGQHYHRH
ncbi:TraR/DksA family transcriptional regulator [Salmonella enterica subsp. enterica]|nr:TraR/DksA family transcriptional regulator [Salmonella enterica subsp. enterica serovar Virchow]